MNGIEQLKRRAEALAENDGGYVVSMYEAADQPDDRFVEYVIEVTKL